MASPNPRPSHLYIPSPRQASRRRKPRTKHLSQPTRGIGDLEGVPDTRSGGSVLEAPPGAEEGALPRFVCFGRPLQTTNPSRAAARRGQSRPVRPRVGASTGRSRADPSAPAGVGTCGSSAGRRQSVATGEQRQQNTERRGRREPEDEQVSGVAGGPQPQGGV